MAAASVLFPFFDLLHSQSQSIPWWTLMDPNMMAQIRQHCHQFPQQERQPHSEPDNEQPCSSRQAAASADAKSGNRCPRSAAASRGGCQTHPKFNWEEFLTNAPAIVEAMLEDFLKPESQEEGEQSTGTSAPEQPLADPATVVPIPESSRSEVSAPVASANEILPPEIGPADFQIKLDVSTYRPEELTVKTVDNLVIVEGKEGEREDEHGFILSSFTRKYKVPQGVKSESISCQFTTDGFLIISAPVVLERSDAGGRSVPINLICGPVRE